MFIGSPSFPAVIPGGNDLVLSLSTTRPVQEPLGVETINGDLQRLLTDPAPDQSDEWPTVASRQHMVYFVRTTFRNVGGGNSIGTRVTLMQVGLAPGSKPHAVRTPIGLYTASVTDDGSLVAGGCDHGHACILNTVSGTVTVVPLPQQRVTVDGITISPDGRWLAYSAPVTNPYGISEIFFYNVAERVTTMVTALPGQNGFPAWAPRGSRPCVAFAHYELPTGSSIRLACASPARVSIQLLPVGDDPIWLR
jgi:hypothetical protein